MSASPLPGRGRVTINQVAQIAGVSKASVSRYIGNDRQLLANATAERIERAIAQLDYRPNQMARGLKGGRTRLIGMLLADILNPYSVAVMHGVEMACREQGYSLVVCNTNRDPEQERHHLNTLQSYNIEGLIVNTLGHHPGELRALHQHLPMVLIDRQLAELDTDLVGLDNADALSQALEHLQQQGFRDILLVCETLDGTSSRLERVQAFHREMSLRPELKGQMVQTDGSLQDSLSAFLSSSGPGPKAIFACNGVACLQATRALRELKCQLFEDVGLLALDDLDWYPLVGNGISALAQPTAAIGRSAFARLRTRLDGNQEPTQRVSHKAQLIIRGSSQLRA
jgi:LacI family kdg operon repressor